MQLHGNCTDWEGTPWMKYTRDVLSGRIVACELVKLACERFLRDLENPLYRFNMDVLRIVGRIFNSVHHYKDFSKGKVFQPSPWQWFILANLYGLEKEIYDEYEDQNFWVRKYNRAYLTTSRKSGKELSLDTPIPTPEGWTTMGDLKVGDYVFGADGKPTKIWFKSDVDYSPEAYRITFEDGTTVDACADHQWFVKTKSKYHPTKVMSSKELFNSTYKRVRADGKGTEYLYRVPMAQPVEYSAKNLPLDPYILGVWLGDGTLGKGQISTDERDLEMYDYLNEILGRPHIKKDKRGHGVCLDYHLPLKNKLEELGVLNNKHIPQVYLQGSVEQRMALLQGLMDTDGYCAKNGECEIQQKNVQLADGICELLSSLGIKYSRMEKIPTIDGVVKDKVQRIHFFTDKQRPCFRLARKYDRLKEKLNDRMRWKSIIDIHPTESVPMQCVEVEKNAFGEGLYLFGKTFTVTHNTPFTAMLCIVDLLTSKGGEAVAAANSREQAHILFDFASTWVKNDLDPQGRTLKVLRNSILNKKNNSTLKVISSDAHTGDGYSPSCGCIDEYHEADDNSLLEVLSSGMVGRRNVLLNIITTAGLRTECPCKMFQDTCEEILKGTIEAENQFVFIATLDPEDDWKDPAIRIKANPNYLVTAKKDAYDDLVHEAIIHPEKEHSTVVKNFNVWRNADSVWIPDKYIENAMTRDGKKWRLDFEEFRGEPCYIGLDFAESSDLTAACFMFSRIDPETERTHYYSRTEFWLPEKTIETCPAALQTYYRLMREKGFLHIAGDEVTDYDAILNYILEVQENYDLYIQRVMLDRYNGTLWASQATNLGLPVEFCNQSMGNFTAPTRMVESTLRVGELHLDANPMMLWNFRCVTLETSKDGKLCKPGKKSYRQQRIDGVIALCECYAGYIVDNNSAVPSIEAV